MNESAPNNQSTLELRWQPDLSVESQETRTLMRTQKMGAPEAARKVKFADESVAAGLELLNESYERSPSDIVLEHIGNFFVNAGQKTIAQNIFKSLHYDGHELHVTNLIYANLKATRALVDDRKKILFIPIPKCGSSSVKNYFSAAIYGKQYGELVHFRNPELYRTIYVDEMATIYKDYYKFSVVRDPLKRIASYFSRNVMQGSLRREAFSKGSFMGYSTKPGALQVNQGFHFYRQAFIDFRHHTDPIYGYLDPFKEYLDKIYQMNELDRLRELLSDTYKKAIKDDRAMVSSDANKTLAKRAESLAKMNEKLYKRDYDTYI